MMKKLISILSLLFLSLFSLNILAANNKVRDIFVQTAPEASITKLAQPHSYQLSLKNIQNYATYFSDHPRRTTNIVTLQAFLDIWNKGLSKNTSNASISGVVNNKPVNFPAELTQPNYDAESRTLTYIIHPLEGKESTIPSELHMSDVSLFIDSLCLSCLG